MRKNPRMSMLTFFNSSAPTVARKQPSEKRFSLLRDIVKPAPKSCGCGGK